MKVEEILNKAYQEYRDRPVDYPDGFDTSFSLKHAWETGFMLGLKLGDLQDSSLCDNSYENYRKENAGRESIYACKLEEYFKEGCFKGLNITTLQTLYLNHLWDRQINTGWVAINELDVEPRKF